MFYVIFNGQASDNIGLKVEHRPIIPVPEQEIEYIEVEGRDGSLTRRKGYKDISIPVEFGAKHNNLPQLMRNIRAWLLEHRSKELIFSDDLDYFYKVKAIRCGNIERELKSIGKFTAEFICDPFQYMQSGKESIILTAPDTIHNLGTRYSEPSIKIYGSGDVVLWVGNIGVAITDIDEYIEINTVLKDVYKGTILQTNKMQGKFPILEPGEINIDWTGNITKVEITPNWRCL